jgi:endonuclease IV
MKQKLLTNRQNQEIEEEERTLEEKLENDSKALIH